MSFNKKTNCSNCGHPLHLQDLQLSEWDDTGQIFYFICQSCEHETIVKYKLFNANGHLNKITFRIIKDDTDYIRNGQLAKVTEHLSSCELCRQQVDEEYLEEVEEKVRSNEKSLAYFLKHAHSVNLKVVADVVGFRIKSFIYEGLKLDLNSDDEFYSDDNTVYYYIKKDQCLVGMACFKFVNANTILDRIWLRSPEVVNKERDFFQGVKEGRIKIRLDSIQKIFHALNN